MKETKSLRYTKKPVCFSSEKGRKAKKDYFDNLDLRNVTDNKTFWKTVQPLFTDKGMIHDKIILAADDERYLLK